VLAKALLSAGRYTEAEPALRRVIADAVAAEDYRTASLASIQLLNLLRDTGRLQEAPQTAQDLADYSRQARMGPWTRLSHEGQRLQVLNAMGRYQEVLDRVEALRPEMAALPEPEESDASINPWNVQEGLLNTGHTAALGLERWKQALALNAERLEVKEGRGAGALELARTRFNDLFPAAASGAPPGLP
jgi:hypothetical protein